MPAVFVHGVPETSEVWDPLISAIGRDDVVALRLPAFGEPRPDGFDAHQETYAAWLAAELQAFDDVDLVTHDWGAILTLRVLADRPANVRSWVSDMGDLGPDFEWHDTAKIWQTPGDGEAFMEAFIGGPIAERAALLGAVGVPEPGATNMAGHLDAVMGDAILDLYRSSTDLGNDWGPGIDQITAPGLLIESMQDPFRRADRVVRLAERTGSKVAQLPEAGHFWMLDSTELGAAAIKDFWAGL